MKNFILSRKFQLVQEFFKKLGHLNDHDFKSHGHVPSWVMTWSCTFLDHDILMFVDFYVF